ncbi:hypothetical protein [Streptomyces niveus]|uniref:hypothetical protein n=1 Tax=Streptomyces niveus TaxID=193462 RepID=UPI0003C5B552|nr:hypothetical protein [Streptomyces niveus]EST22763.1 hypothetical protein M877_28705 [Streptomyces niveus NCIMB 11891]
MGDIERPVEGRPDQEEQARLIRRTGNGPTVVDEQKLLTARFGAPDMAGTYHGSDAPAVGDSEGELVEREAVPGEPLPPVPDSAYPADSVALPDAPKGGESA